MNNTHWDYPEPAYLKDTDNFLDNFVGTWKYQNGSEHITIVLKKEIKHNYHGLYSDILYGEYKYINSAGQSLVDRLNMIDYAYSSMGYHMISGATLIKDNETPLCNICTAGEFRVKSFFNDPVRKGLSTRIVFKYVNATTIIVKLYGKGRPAYIDDFQETLPDYPQVPLGEYTMIKQ